MALRRLQGDPQQSGYTIFKEDQKWYVSAPDTSTFGPYFEGRLALQVALARLLRERKRGPQPPLHVRDDSGRLRRCAAGDTSGACETCQIDGSTQHSPCPLGAELQDDIRTAAGRMDRDHEFDGLLGLPAPVKPKQKNVGLATRLKVALEALVSGRESRRQAVVTVIVICALLSCAWLMLHGQPQSVFSKAPIAGRIVARTSKGGCERFEFDNKSAALTSKGAITCEYFVDRRQQPVPRSSTAGAAEAETGNGASERLKSVRDHWNKQ